MIRILERSFKREGLVLPHSVVVVLDECMERWNGGGIAIGVHELEPD